MIFSSLLFLYAFLPVFFGLYYLSPGIRLRNAVALLASLLFYAWGEPVFAGILVISSMLDYALSLWLVRLALSQANLRRGVLTLGVVANLGVLAYCKYANFFVEQANAALGLFGGSSLAWTAIVLPIGVSFFTFQKLSYLVDIYRGDALPARNVGDYILFVALFPQLIAGPIIRYHDVDQQIRHRDHTLDRFISGLWRFLLGVGRKVLIANPLGQVADTAFAQPVDTLPLPFAWIGILAYTFQIYFDFAGYSDMAVGLGRMMGFEFLENFDRPYTARSVTDFWRRWHMSLSNFMRDYLYVPLGGNRVAPWRVKLNLWLTFLASGLWHGASWNFIVWGAYHGGLLSLERGLGRDRLRRIPAVLGVTLTFGLVMVGWVFFRAETLPGALTYLSRLVALDSWALAGTNPDLLWPDIMSYRAAAMLILAALCSFIPEGVWKRWGWDEPLALTWTGAIARTALGAAFLLLSTAALANSSYNPFIYFRF